MKGKISTTPNFSPFALSFVEGRAEFFNNLLNLEP